MALQRQQLQQPVLTDPVGSLFSYLPEELQLAILSECLRTDEDPSKRFIFISRLCRHFHALTRNIALRQTLTETRTLRLFEHYANAERFAFAYLNDITLSLKQLARTPIYRESDDMHFKLAKTALRMQQLFEIMLRLTANNIITFSMPVTTQVVQAGATVGGGYVRIVDETTYPLITAEVVERCKTQFKCMTDMLHNDAFASRLSSEANALVFNQQFLCYRKMYASFKKYCDNRDQELKPSPLTPLINTIKLKLFTSNKEIQRKDMLLTTFIDCAEQLDHALNALKQIFIDLNGGLLKLNKEAIADLTGLLDLETPIQEALLNVLVSSFTERLREQDIAPPEFFHLPDEADLDELLKSLNRQLEDARRRPAAAPAPSR